MRSVKNVYLIFVFFFIVPSSLGLIDELAKNAKNSVVSLVTNLYNLLTGGISFIEEDIYLTMNKELKDMTPSNGEEYDFIIVGAGSAGSVMASRLSEIKNVTILLIEAGSKENLIEDIPVIAPYLQFFDSILYNYKTEPSKNYCQGMVKNECSFPRGKVMGGSSVLNFMSATRGHQEVYNNWASMGNEGWSFNDLLKYFKKLETFNSTLMDTNYHGFNGPMYIETPQYSTDISKAFLEAAKEKGFSEIDYDGKEQIGFAHTHATIHNGERWSTNKAYLYPVHKQHNLFLTRNSHVNKILFDNSNFKKAHGVSFTKSGLSIKVRAKKEVIVCTGSIDSPKLLMLSGIGPIKQLQKSKIQIVHDLPGVGENLMDHMSYWNLIFTVNDSVTIAPSDLLSPTAVGDYLKKKQGPLTIPAAAEVLGFINIDNLESKQGIPNIEYSLLSTSLGTDLFIHKIMNVDEDHFKTFRNLLGKRTFTITIILLTPKSRGKIWLNNEDPKSNPRIYPNYLSEPDDIRVLTKGIKFGIELSKTKALQKYNSTLVKNPILGCESLEMYSDKYWECALRTFGTTTWHPAGTCKMGPENDSMAVVDSRLKVYGIDKLRIVDASIMPEIVPGHLNVPIIAIAEKAADMVKEDWGYPTN